ILAKFGFPAILKTVEKRAQVIDESLETAKKTEARLAHVTQESAEIIADAEKQKLQIIAEAQQQGEQLIAEAKRTANLEHERIVAQAMAEVEAKQKTMQEQTRSEVATISIAIAEKLLRQNLTDKVSQTELAQRLYKEMKQS
ncbi:MAG: F0F1 ATP synthase subunit B, partial [Bacteroidales bacterium]